MQHTMRKYEFIVYFRCYTIKVSGNMFNVFLETALKLLKTPNSCVQGKSVLLLNRMIADMAVHGAM